MNWRVDYHQAPLLLIWEVTRSCALACQHCRAAAIDYRDPNELSTDEGRALIDQVADMGTPLMVFTGGDPLQREDLEDLIRHAKSRKLTVGTIPATTPRLTRERIHSLKAAGVDQIAVSVDGPSTERHDAFRGVPGTFDKVLEAAAWVKEAGVALQANTVFGSWNVNEFDRMAALVSSLGVVFWEVFFLVPTGRGTGLQGCTAEQIEMLFDKLERLAETAPFVIKVTEGQHLRRFVTQREAAAGGADEVLKRARAKLMLAGRPVNSGHGFCFVDHLGNICPSGFLPLPCGNVRDQPQAIAAVYRNHAVFKELRDFSLLKGKCGVCEFRDLCSGGSRARAYALTGDYLAPEPFCAYEPPAR